MNKIINIGQKESKWSEEWKSITPETEIRMWDYYGGRQYITKYVPRFGKVLEAGCGLGRYVFYLSRFGINIEGLEFSKETIEYLRKWQNKYGFNKKFVIGDVTNLPYEDNSLRGYISLGVVEHFIEGPNRPIKEAFRVLEPGGIAIITTPSLSWNVIKNRTFKEIKNILKKIIGYKKQNEVFFQYEYRPKKLKNFIENCGLKVTLYDNCDLLYSFLEFYNFNEEKIKPDTLPFWFSNKFEKTFLRALGSQSITVSVKVAEKMYCFFCGNFSANKDSLKYYSVPVCSECNALEISKFYKYGIFPSYAAKYIFNPPIKKPTEEVCEISGEKYLTDELFEDFGFTIKVSPEILKKPVVNILLSNKHIQPIWRNRKRYFNKWD